MTDVLYTVRDDLRRSSPPLPDGVEPGGFYVGTLHRPDNPDSPDRLAAIVSGLASLDRPVLLLAHPRLTGLAEQHGIDLAVGAIRPRQPLAYPHLVNAVMNSAGVITDSGGLQKEAFLLRVPCTTIRPETEWVETVELGWNVLVDEDLGLLPAIVQRDRPHETDAQPYGDGRAAARAVDALLVS
jgi:UDP-N-acetylglucosamine 2-epimerase (non-hydrolysing)